MSATLAQSIAWDELTIEQKRIYAAQLVPGAYYGLHCFGQFGTAVLRCLNAETSQFRVISHTPPADSDHQNMTDWLVTVEPDALAKLTRISTP